ncbi:MAG: hypothetical protein ACYS7M_09115 [Planctomycetota bacterium]|jgi:hypothetical protein
MRILGNYGRYGCWLIALTLAACWGCAQPDGGGDGADGTGGDGSGGSTGGFVDNGLPAPGPLPAGEENVPPTGGLLFPLEGGVVPVGEVVFVWEGTDENGTNIDSTIYVSDQADVFDNPVLTQGVRTPPEEVEHRFSIQLPDAGTFFWGVEISDGVNLVRRQTSDVGLQFEISETASGRIGLEDAILLCPSSTLPARSVTTFHWSLGEAIPLRTQVFVSRAGLDNPFDTPLLVLEVEPPTDTSRPLADADALPLGDLLSWGLRLQTADAVLFSFEGQVGEAFLVDAKQRCPRLRLGGRRRELRGRAEPDFRPGVPGQRG